MTSDLSAGCRAELRFPSKYKLCVTASLGPLNYRSLLLLTNIYTHALRVFSVQAFPSILRLLYFINKKILKMWSLYLPFNWTFRKPNKKNVSFVNPVIHVDIDLPICFTSSQCDSVQLRFIFYFI